MHVLFFEGSVKGLNVGSPVKFRGVDIGMVKNIKLSINPEDLEFFVPVYVEIYTNRISILGGKELEELGKFDDEEAVDTLVNDMGLRAQLQMQSLLTGQLFINYDFYPETPARKVGLEKKVYEVPTIPTTLQMLTDTLEQIAEQVRQADFHQIMTDIAATAKGANELLNSADLRESVTQLNSGLHDMQRFIERADDLVAKINNRADTMADTVEAAMDDTRTLVNTIGARIDPAAADLENTLAAARVSFAEAESLLVEARELISDNSRLRREIVMTLESMSDASRSVEDLTEYLQRHPESLITGKK
jgi:paraquat-inducible protein B